VFNEYILPKLSKFPSDGDLFVRSTYASSISLLAESASRFLDMAQALHANRSISYNEEDAENVYTHGNYDSLYDADRRELLTTFQEHVVALLADTESAVRRALLGTITSLCLFFGRQRSNDFLLSHLITYLNDRDWMLRCAFFDSIVGVATFVGGKSLEMYILPLLSQAVTGKSNLILLTLDTEEFVIERVLNALASLTELGLFQKSSVLDLSKSIVKLVVHPNIWVSNGAIGFLATSAKAIGPIDAQALLYPILRPYLLCDISVISEQRLLDFKQKPIPRAVYDAALNWASKAERTNYWKMFKENSNESRNERNGTPRMGSAKPAPFSNSRTEE
jgi:phosphoinositide-3-kinase, regulatory subunit 4